MREESGPEALRITPIWRVSLRGRGSCSGFGSGRGVLVITRSERVLLVFIRRAREIEVIHCLVNPMQQKKFLALMPVTPLLRNTKGNLGQRA